MSGARFPAAAGRSAAALIFASGCASACAARAAGHPHATSRSATAKAVASIVESGRDELHLSGVAVVIFRGHDIVLARGYGLADRATGRVPTADTLFPIGSLSKQFTAAAVMRLVEEGRLSLDDPVSLRLPAYPAGLGPPPRIRELLNQTSGLSEWDEWPELQEVDTGDPDRFQGPRFLAALAKHPPLYAPGAWWSYSNTNYRLLADVVEQVSGEDFDLYLARTLLEPLGLRGTGGCASSRRAAAAPRATGYEFENGDYVLRPLGDVKARAFVGSGGMCSTAADLARWMRALVGGRAVSPASYRDMTAPAEVAAGFTAPYGFGLSLRRLAGQEAVWHIGVLAGYTAVLAYFPERDVVIAAVANARHALLHTVVKRIAGAILGLPAPPPLRDLTIDRRELDRVVGEYHDGMFPFRVYAQGDALFVHVPPLGPPLRLRYQGGHEFATGEPEDLHFRFEPSQGPVRRVDWEWGELRAFGRRIP